MMNLQAILFDLDDTLLGNDLERFTQHYFALLSQYAAQKPGLENMLPDLIASTRQMLGNNDPTTTNADVFWEAFSRRTGQTRAELEPFFEHFYREHFPQLRSVTQMRPAARPLINYCLAQGWQVVIATNPLFPRSAIEQRLAWADAPASEFPYALVTSYENMHAAKPHPAYYHEILATIGCRPEAALMVGDDWLNDIQPATTAGLRAYWVTENGPPPDPALVVGWGSLDALYTALVQGVESAVPEVRSS